MGRGNSGKPYGTEFRTLLKNGNIKFIQYRDAKNAAPVRITQTRGRVYVTVNGDGNLVQVTYFDTNNKRSKAIDLNHTHKGIKPHTHHGYNHNENDGPKGAANLTVKERKMVERVLDIWYNRNGK